MKITMTSDLHGHWPETPGGDLLIVAGDLTARDSAKEHNEFSLWLYQQPYTKKIVVAGNHDTLLEKIERGYNLYEVVDVDKHIQWPYADYLYDSMTEFDGLKIWGSPWSKYFDGINPKCAAFMKTDAQLKLYYDEIPDDIDILVSHGPAYGILDESIYDQEPCGSVALRETLNRIKPKIFVCGHIHEGYGHLLHMDTYCYNVSHMDVRYRPVNPVVNMEI